MVELLVEDAAELRLDQITQEARSEPRENWQVPYDQHFLDAAGEQVLNPNAPHEPPPFNSKRLVFFFHYLDFRLPLRTPAGDLPLPSPGPVPRRLRFLQYEAP